MTAPVKKALFLAPEPAGDYEALGRRIREAEQQVKIAGYALGDAWWNLIARINGEFGIPANAHVNTVPMQEMDRIGTLTGYTPSTIRYYRAILARISLGDLHALIDETGSFSGAVFRLKGRSLSGTGTANRRRTSQHSAWTSELRKEMGVTRPEAREMIDYYLQTTTWEHIAEVWDSREPDFP